MSRTRQVPAAELEPFEDRIDSLFRELELAIKWQRPSILFAICGSEPVQVDADLALEGRVIDLGHKVFRFQVKPEDADVAARIAKIADPSETVFYVSGLGRGGGKGGTGAYAALNKQREYFIENHIRVVFWLSEAEAVALANHAPDYWAYRHRVIEFTGSRASVTADRRSIEPARRPDGVSLPGLEGAGEAVLANEALEPDPPETDEASAVNANLHLTLGLLHWRRGDHERASTYLRTALENAILMEDHWFEAECLNAIALVSTDLGRTDEAIEAYQQAIRLAPSQIFPWNNLGKLYARLGRNDEALDAFQKAIEHNPEDAIGWNGLGSICLKMGRTGQAVEAYRRTVELAPDSGWPYSSLGLALHSQGKHAEAVSALKKGIQLLRDDKEKAITWNRLGDAYQGLNDARNAMAAYQKAVELDAGPAGPAAVAEETAPQAGELDATSPMVPEGTDAAGFGLRLEDQPESWLGSLSTFEEIEFPTSLGQPAAAPGEAPGREAASEIRNDSAFETLETNAQNPAEAFIDDNPLASQAFEIPARTGAGADPADDEDLGLAAAREQDELDDRETGQDAKNANEWNALGHTHLQAGNFDEAIAAYTRAIEAARDFNWPYIHNLAMAHYHKGEHKGKSTKAAHLAGLNNEAASAPHHYEEPTTEPIPGLSGGSGQPAEPARRSVPAEGDPEGYAGHSLNIEPEAAAPEDAGVKGGLSEWLNELEDEKALSPDAAALDSVFSEEAPPETEAAPQPMDEVDPATLEDTAQIPTRRHRAVAQPGTVEPAREDSREEPEVEDAPRTALEWNEQGNIHLKAGACDRAIAAYIKAIELSPKFGWPYSNLGLAYSHKGKYSEAIPIYRKSIELLKSNKEKAISWNRMGDAYRRLNDHDHAVAAYQKAVELDSGAHSLLKRVRLSLLGNVRA